VNEPLVIARAVHLAATLLLTGVLAFRCFVAVPVFHAKAGAAIEAVLRVRLAWVVWTALAAALASGAAWLVLLAAEIGDVPVGDAIVQGWPWLVLTDTAFGDVWMLRAGLAVLLAVVLLAGPCAARVERGKAQGQRSSSAPRAARPFADFASLNPGYRTDFFAALLAAALAASLAWTGHAAGMEGIDGDIHLTSDALHLIAAGAWLGALWPLAILLGAARRAGDPASAAIASAVTRRFSALGMISVAVILASGVINTYEILGLSAFSLGTDYNRLLLAKIGLFVAMVAIAAVNRQRLTQRLSGGDGRAMRQLQLNSLTETGLGLLILAIVAVLGRMTPHMH
jgi:copper resistance protein D